MYLYAGGKTLIQSYIFCDVSKGSVIRYPWGVRFFENNNILILDSGKN